LYFYYFYANGGHFHCSSFEAALSETPFEESSQSNSGANHKALVSVVDNGGGRMELGMRHHFGGLCLFRSMIG